MGLCGDAVKATKNDLANFLELQERLNASKQLEIRARETKQALADDVLLEQMLALSSQINQQRSETEDLERTRKRHLADLELVQKRLDQDQQRLAKTAVARDAIGLQHEIETLTTRIANLKAELDGLSAEIESRARAEHELAKQKADLEGARDEAIARAKLELESLRSEHSSIAAKVGELRGEVDAELLQRFDRLADRGIAIGRLIGTRCGACNLSLTASALADIAKVAADELASCPECQAMLVRA
jgi:uncharacterized protein